MRRPAAQSDYSTGAGTGRGVIPCPAGSALSQPSSIKRKVRKIFARDSRLNVVLAALRFVTNLGLAGRDEPKKAGRFIRFEPDSRQNNKTRGKL